MVSGTALTRGLHTFPLGLKTGKERRRRTGKDTG